MCCVVPHEVLFCCMLLFCRVFIACFVLSGLMDKDPLNENSLDEDLLDKCLLANSPDKDSNLPDKGPNEKN